MKVSARYLVYGLALVAAGGLALGFDTGDSGDRDVADQSASSARSDDPGRGATPR